MTCEGITADLITSGRVDTGVVQIMHGSDPTFRWDSRGLSAYHTDEENIPGGGVVITPNTK
jgi:hypothetical protein